MREYIRNGCAELEEIGWNQVLSDEEMGDGESASSEEAPDYMAAIANAERRNMRARENPEDRRIRHNRNRPAVVVDLLSDEDMPAAAGAGQAAQGDRANTGT